jgi:glycosyltransferase involved in cell wall biosynthesis
MMLNVLILFRDVSWHGGVVNFVEVLRRNLGSGILTEHFLIGKRPGSDHRTFAGVTTLTDCRRLYSRLRKGDIEVVHLNPSLNFNSLVRDGLFLLVLKMQRFRRCLIFFHGWEPSVEKVIRKNDLLGNLLGWLLKQGALILVLSNTFKDFLVNIGVDQNRVQHITTMFDGELLQKGRKGRPEANKRLLFLSRFIREKGGDELLEAFGMLSQECPGLSLTCAGDGPEMARMKAWVRQNGLEERVYFPGYLRGAAKAEVLQEADLFVLPTYYGEGCPVALIEAMAAGLPVITTPVGGIPDIVEQDRNGILLDEVTPHRLAAAIRSLLSKPELMAEMGVCNEHKAWSIYESKVVSSRIESIYRKLALED